MNSWPGDLYAVSTCKGTHTRTLSLVLLWHSFNIHAVLLFSYHLRATRSNSWIYTWDLNLVDQFSSDLTKHNYVKQTSIQVFFRRNMGIILILFLASVHIKRSTRPSIVKQVPIRNTYLVDSHLLTVPLMLLATLCPYDEALAFLGQHEP